jgi:hypothetical protein
VSVKDGRLVLPDGMSYRVLVLPDRSALPVEILQKVKELVEAGATVVGPRPEKDPSLKNYPQCDEQVRRLAGELWGDCDGKTVKQRRVGQGRIVWGPPLREVLTESGVMPDFAYAGKDESAFLDFIKYYSGTATYTSEKFALPESLIHNPPSAIYLDLGEVKNVARVRLNGKDLGVLWTRPFRVEITGAVQPADNLLEISVTNLWPNRLIGDAALPAEKRFTRTHVTTFNKDTPLLSSGLLGPVTLRAGRLPSPPGESGNGGSPTRPR